MILFERTDKVPESARFEKLVAIVTPTQFAFESDSPVVTVWTEPVQKVDHNEEEHHSTQY